MNEENKQTTEQILTEMLTESTGKALMDSGDAYGRHWEENRKNGIKTGFQICDFYRNDEEKTCELIPTIPIFDAFKNSLEYTEECKYLESLIPSDIYSYDGLYFIEEEIKQGKVYEKINNLVNNRILNVLHSDFIGARIQLLGATLNYANNLLKHLHRTPFKENTYVGTKVSNSYNYEDFLSQCYMSVFFEYNDESYIAVSIHNGCDIRGGYTDIHIFKCEQEDEFLNTHYDVAIDCINDNRKFNLCDYGYHMYGREEYYSHNEQNDVDEHYIYQHTYIDENGELRCKECDGLIVCSAIEY